MVCVMVVLVLVAMCAMVKRTELMRVRRRRRSVGSRLFEVDRVRGSERESRSLRVQDTETMLCKKQDLLATVATTWIQRDLGINYSHSSDREIPNRRIWGKKLDDDND